MIAPVSKTQHNIAQGVSPGFLYAMRDIFTERASALGILYAMRAFTQRVRNHGYFVKHENPRIRNIYAITV